MIYDFFQQFQSDIQISSLNIDKSQFSIISNSQHSQSILSKSGSNDLEYHPLRNKIIYQSNFAKIKGNIYYSSLIYYLNREQKEKKQSIL